FFEDVTKKIAPRVRLGLAIASALLAVVVMKASVTRLGISVVDSVLQTHGYWGVLLTMLLLSGLTNAYNIIDGFHGLVGVIAFLVNLSLFYVAYKVNDQSIIFVTLAFAGVLLGFIFWNYPKGYIFLGDGGAYFIGFFLGVVSILLVNRNPQVSPWFAFLIHLYPVTETLFSIYRRRFRGAHVTAPDGLHFHSLVYRRLVRWVTQEEPRFLNRNAMTSPYLWALSLFTLAPAVLFWQNDWPLQLSGFVFVPLYVYLYFRIVRFKAPRFLILRPKSVGLQASQKRADRPS
ncbi:MAG: glycosyltransferase, partial [Bdellovibrionaceae bacterium]|nr:glycosyltransferase [Pseudobdellovibrionaceae bacterium]